MTQRRLLCFSLLLSFTLSVHASSAGPLDVGTMVDRADLIFVGTVTGTASVPTGDGNFAFTLVTFDVEETLKGIPRSGRTFTLLMPGGRSGDNVWEVAGMPRFEPGGQHLLFIHGNRRSLSPLVGTIQGKLDVVADPVTREAILVDSARRVIDGMRDDQWQRGGLRLGRGESYEQLRSPGIAVVSQEGVQIEIPEPEAIADFAAPAAKVIDGLRAYIDQRKASSAAYRHSQFVDSASAGDVPATFVFTPVRPNARAK